jgi:hypothetical protein
MRALALSLLCVGCTELPTYAGLDEQPRAEPQCLGFFPSERCMPNTTRERCAYIDLWIIRNNPHPLPPDTVGTWPVTWCPGTGEIRSRPTRP